MATRKAKNTPSTSRSKPARAEVPASDEPIGSILGTVSAPSSVSPNPKSPLLSDPSQKRLGTQKAGGQALAAAQSVNPLKKKEFGLEDGHRPAEGTPVQADDPIATASTVSEVTPSANAGEARPQPA